MFQDCYVVGLDLRISFSSSLQSVEGFEMEIIHA